MDFFRHKYHDILGIRKIPLAIIKNFLQSSILEGNDMKVLLSNSFSYGILTVFLLFSLFPLCHVKSITDVDTCMTSLQRHPGFIIDTESFLLWSSWDNK